MKVKAFLSIGYNDVTQIIEIPDEDIDGFVDEDLDAQIMQYVEEWVNQHLSYGYEVIK